MVTTFEDRESAFETKFVHDEELKFRARARRDKLFARWAAGRLGLAGAAWDDFVRELLAVQGFPRHETALLRFATERLTQAGQDAADAPAILMRLGEEAADQVRQGTTAPVDLSAPPAA
jgi:hypothetical protein